MVSIPPGWAQVAVTTVLVIITGLYARQTQRQVRLVRDQISRDARRYHTDILRPHLDTWMENLPTVRGGRAISALNIQSIGHPFFDEEDTFWTIPITLEDDVYFQDFLDNHAEECARLKTDIESSYTEFQELREEFYEEYDGYDSLEELPFDAEPLEGFPLWAFENGVILERGGRTREKQKENLEQAIENDKRAQRPPGKKYLCSLYGWDSSYIVEAEVFERGENGESEVIDEREEQVIQALHETVDQLPERPEYELIEAAADTLEQVEQDISRLEQRLEEYRGMEIVPGNCEYIADIDDQTGVLGKLLE